MCNIETADRQHPFRTTPKTMGKMLVFYQGNPNLQVSQVLLVVYRGHFGILPGFLGAAKGSFARRPFCTVFLVALRQQLHGLHRGQESAAPAWSPVVRSMRSDSRKRVHPMS